MEKRIDKIARNDKEKKRRRKRLLTQEEKEYITNKRQRFKKMIEFRKQLSVETPWASVMKFNREFKEEFKQEESKQEDNIIPICEHKKTIVDIDGTIICRYCGIAVIESKENKGTKKKLIGLFCTHKETKKENGFEVCIKCGGKWKK